MNETVKIIFGLLGGLAVFIYGMNMMSECLQKAAGEKMKAILAMLTKNPVLRSACRSAYYSSASKQQCYNSHGNRLCQRGTYELTAGNFNYFRC